MLAVPGTRFAVPARDLPARSPMPTSRRCGGDRAAASGPDPGHAFPLFHSRDALFRRALAIVDVLGAYFGLLFAVLVVAMGSRHARPAALIGPFVVLASKAIGLYDRDQHTLRKTTLDELPSILYLSVFYALAVWLTGGVILDGWFDSSRGVRPRGGDVRLDHAGPGDRARRRRSP